MAIRTNTPLGVTLSADHRAAARRTGWQQVGTIGGIALGTLVLLGSPIVLLGAGCDHQDANIDVAACDASFNRLLILVLLVGSIPLISAVATLAKDRKMRKRLSPLYLLGACFFGVVGLLSFTTLVGPVIFGSVGYGLFCHIPRKSDAEATQPPPPEPRTGPMPPAGAPGRRTQPLAKHS